MWKRPETKTWAISYIVLSVLSDILFGRLSLLRDLLIAVSLGLILGVVKGMADQPSMPLRKRHTSGFWLPFPFGVRLRLGSALTVWFRSADGEKQNVEIAEQGHDQSIVQALSPDGSSVGLCVDEVAHFSDNPGDRSAADDGHDHHA